MAAPSTGSVPPAGPVLLAELTTLGLGGPARELVTVTDPADLAAALAGPAEAALVIGGGSNLVVADAGVAARVVRIAVPGLRIDGDLVTIGAGEPWDSVVDRLVGEGFTGLAPLSGIPGSTGATPVQNVGAYGAEIADTLISVDLFDRTERTYLTATAAELGLGYRTSVLRGTNRAVVTGITLRLGRGPLPVRYAELARTLGVAVGEPAPETAVRAAVLGLRAAKGMVLNPADPDSRSAGSFFTNPILDARRLAVADAAIRARLGEGISYPAYPDGAGGTKLSAAWLIERAGFAKGHPGPGGRVGLSSKHTLALVNRGGSTADLLALAREVRDAVLAAFTVRLEPEPVLVGVTLD